LAGIFSGGYVFMLKGALISPSQSSRRYVDQFGRSMMSAGVTTPRNSPESSSASIDPTRKL